MTRFRAWHLCLLALSMSAQAQVDCPNFSITQQSSSQTACIGDEVTLAVEAIGNGPLSYQWRRNCLPILGATDSSLILAAIEEHDYGTYSVSVSDSCGVLVSQEIRLEPDPILVPLGLGTPYEVSLCAGAQRTIEVPVQDPTFSYQWRLECDPILGETNSYIEIENLPFNNGDSLFCVVSNGCASVTLHVANLFRDLGTLAITQQPQDRNVCEGDDVTFEVMVQSQGLQIQEVSWFVDDERIVGQNDLSLALSDVQASNIGVYNAVITTDCGSFTTDPALLEVEPCIDPDSDFKQFLITASWTDAQNDSFAIDANGNGGVSVQEVELVTGTLDLSGLTFNDYSGIELFTNLSILDLSAASLLQIPNLSALVSLQRLILDQNQLGDPAASGFATLPTGLQALSLQNNLLRSLPSLASLTSLSDLDASFNRLTDVQLLVSENAIGGNASDSIDLSYNLLAGTTNASSTNCTAIADLLSRTTASGATFSFNPQYNFLLYSEWPSFVIDVRNLISDGTIDLSCTAAR